ncbi:sensor histidine kinase [Flavitalea flava]
MKSIFHFTIHEIGIPLEAIVSGCSKVKEEWEKGNAREAREILNAILSSAHNLSEIFGRVRQSIREEEIHKFQLDESIIDFKNWIYDLLNSMTGIFMEKDIFLSIKIANDFPQTIYSDRTYLTQIVYNIVMNALKFSPKASMISIHCFIREKDNFCIEITDQGIGIPSSQIPFIFNEYLQTGTVTTCETDSDTDSETGSTFGGMGLGLSVVKNLVEVLGGSISVKSEEGVGSIFTVSVPIKEFDISFL